MQQSRLNHIRPAISNLTENAPDQFPHLVRTWYMSDDIDRNSKHVFISPEERRSHIRSSKQTNLWSRRTLKSRRALIFLPYPAVISFGTINFTVYCRVAAEDHRNQQTVYQVFHSRTQSNVVVYLSINCKKGYPRCLCYQPTTGDYVSIIIGTEEGFYWYFNFSFSIFNFIFYVTHMAAIDISQFEDVQLECYMMYEIPALKINHSSYNIHCCCIVNV